MVTVGLVKELFFISRVLNDSFYLKLFKGEKQEHELCLKMDPDANLDIWYDGHHIWREQVEGDTSFFGIESCDTISRIIVCINNKDFHNAKLMMQTQEFSLTNMQPVANMKHEEKVING